MYTSGWPCASYTILCLYPALMEGIRHYSTDLLQGEMYVNSMQVNFKRMLKELQKVMKYCKVYWELMCMFVTLTRMIKFKR